MDASDFQGKIYSTMPPGLSVLLILPLFLGSFLQNLPHALDSRFSFLPYAIAGEELAVQVFSVVCTAISVIYLYRLCRTLGAQKYSSLLVCITFAFATPMWVFGKTEFPHSYSALFLLITYYYFLKAPRLDQRNILIAGFSSAIAVSIEYTNLILLIPALIYLLSRSRTIARTPELLKKIGVYFAPIFLSIFLLLVYNYVLFHNPFSFPEDYWIGYDGQSVSALSQFSTPIELGLEGLLISPSRGLLVFSPILFLAIPGAYLLGKTRLRWEAFLLACVFLLNLLGYSKWYLWYGGLSFGPRFLVPALPFLTILIFPFIEYTIQSRRTLARLGYLTVASSLFLWSVVVESIGAITAPIATFSNLSFFQFLNAGTGFTNILKGNLNDLAYVLIANGNFNPEFGMISWVVVVGAIPIVTFIFLIISSVPRKKRSEYRTVILIPDES